MSKKNKRNPNWTRDEELIVLKLYLNIQKKTWNTKPFLK